MTGFDPAPPVGHHTRSRGTVNVVVMAQCIVLAVTAALVGCTFDTPEFDELRCDPLEANCPEGRVCVPPGLCVVDNTSIMPDVTDVTDVTADTAPADTGPPPCGGQACVGDEVCCDGVCVDVTNDVTHCGACGNTCDTTESCQGGFCTCRTGLFDCNDDSADGCETDILTSNEFCGGCEAGNTCSGEFTCDQGACRCDGMRCEVGQECCSTADGDVCIDTQTSREHCGACGAACDTGELCVDGQCMCVPDGATLGPDCDSETQQCCSGECILSTSSCNCGDTIECTDVCCNGTECVDTELSDAHCGACNNACPADRVCDGGTCVCAGANEVDCDGACVDLDEDVAHCGGCGQDCTALPGVTAATCTSGLCEVTMCAVGTSDCDRDPSNGCEVDLTAAETCGDCNNDCTGGPNVDSASCQNGMCELTCASGTADCNGDATDGCETDLTAPETCGDCGNDCTALAGIGSAECQSGTCGGTCAPGFDDCNEDLSDGCEGFAGCRVSDGLIALYTFEEGSGEQVLDRSGVAPLMPIDFRKDKARISWASGRNGIVFGTGGSDGGLLLDTSSPPNQKLEDKIERSIGGGGMGNGTFTIEAWLRPNALSQSGPARIVTYSFGSSVRNFTLGHSGTSINVRIRTSATDVNGRIGGDLMNSGLFAAGRNHVVLTFDSGTGTARVYQNGVEVDSRGSLGRIDTWNPDYRFGIGNEVTAGTERRWVGEVNLVAIYDRVLTPAEIAENFSKGDQISAPAP